MRNLRITPHGAFPSQWSHTSELAPLQQESFFISFSEVAEVFGNRDISYRTHHMKAFLPWRRFSMPHVEFCPTHSTNAEGLTRAGGVGAICASAPAFVAFFSWQFFGRQTALSRTACALRASWKIEERLLAYRIPPLCGSAEALWCVVFLNVFEWALEEWYWPFVSHSLNDCHSFLNDWEEFYRLSFELFSTFVDGTFPYPATSWLLRLKFRRLVGELSKTM